MILLAIETSCDDTSIAIVRDGRHILSNLISSQVTKHARYGGVVPELASRMHTESIHFLIDKALRDAALSWNDIDGIAVTYGPGLEGALLVGLTVAKTLSSLLNKPLYPVNHMHGHVCAHFLSESPPSFPFISLIASGGHTQLVKVTSPMSFECLGETRDDAAGEAFDKVARLLGLGYPGGPLIEKRAIHGSPSAFAFPRAMIHKGMEFSFSGLKTAVLHTVKSIEKAPLPIDDICASFQQCVIDILWKKSLRACEENFITQLVLCGGVTANQALQQAFTQHATQSNIDCFTLSPILCTDNAAMIAAAAHYQCLEVSSLEDIKAQPNLAL